MSDYRHAWHSGGSYFFTVNLLQRHGNDLLTRHLAETVLGTLDPRRRRLPGAHGLRAFQSGEGRVKHVAGWPYSTFYLLVRHGVYPLDWGGGMEASLGYDD